MFMYNMEQDGTFFTLPGMFQHLKTTYSPMKINFVSEKGMNICARL